MKLDLSELKDIHIPVEPDLWPLAWGWWVLFWSAFILAAVCVFFMGWYLSSPKVYALHELNRINHLDGKIFLKEINALLRRAVIYKYGASVGAALYADAWIDFLNQTPGVHFSKEYVALLEKSMYASKENLSDADKKAILTNAKQWIKQNL